MTTEQARELEQRLRARGLSRKAQREAVVCFREWLAEQPAGEPDASIEVLEAAHALIRSIRATP